MRSQLILATFGMVFGAAAALAAPPRVMDSQPQAETLIQGRHTAYVVHFDMPIDHAASSLEVTRDGRVIETVTPRLESGTDVLYGAAETPPPGRYELHWRARSTNGETSEGVIPFTTAR